MCTQFGVDSLTACMHTHNRFMALLDFVWDYPDELAPGR